MVWGARMKRGTVNSGGVLCGRCSEQRVRSETGLTEAVVRNVVLRERLAPDVV